MGGLDAILELCPASDALQRKALEERYRIGTIRDLDEVVVFGAALLGASFARRLREAGVRVIAFSDNDPARWGQDYEGLPLLPPHRIPGRCKVVVASKYVRDIALGLGGELGCRLIPHYVLSLLFPQMFPNDFHAFSAGLVRGHRDAVRQAWTLMADPPSRDLFLTLLRFRISLDPAHLPEVTGGQYFPGPFWTLAPDETFVDVGACGGDTLRDFLQHSRGHFRRYIALEPELDNLQALHRAVPADMAGRIRICACGAGATRQRVEFAAGAGGASRIAGGGGASIEVVPLDELLADEPVTTIKVDVEGYERPVLEGARATIGRCRPKLALSAYHRVEDLWEIVLWVQRRYPGYRYYLRHHTPEVYDTVLYGVPGE